MPYLYIDPWYIILVVPAMLLAFWAQINVNTTFSRYSKVLAPSGMTGAESARRVLEANGVTGVRIERISGNLTDHFDPKTNTIRLSESVYDATTVSAVGVAAHEAGHAVQYAVGYAPMVLLGLIFSSAMLVDIGIIAFSMSPLFQLIPLPVEFNASRRAVATLESSCVSDTEVKGAKAVLRAAALTYVAALAVSLASLLRIILLFGNRNRRD